MDILVILGIVLVPVAIAATKYLKLARTNKLIKDIIDAVKDEEITKEELMVIVQDIKDLFTKKK